MLEQEHVQPHYPAEQSQHYDLSKLAAGSWSEIQNVAEQIISFGFTTFSNERIPHLKKHL